MTTTVRDPWEDARLVATQDVLDPEVARVHRGVWLRRAGTLALTTGVLAVAVILATTRVESTYENLWRVSLDELRAGFGLAGVGLVLMVVGAIRTTGARRRFVGPDALLPRSDRAWLRTQVAEDRHVPDERRTVVTDAARRMVVEGRGIPTDVGLALLYVGLSVANPSPTMLVVFAGLTVFVIVRAVRSAVWSHRGKRWLAQHA